VAGSALAFADGGVSIVIEARGAGARMRAGAHDAYGLGARAAAARVTALVDAAEACPAATRHARVRVDARVLPRVEGGVGGCRGRRSVQDRTVLRAASRSAIALARRLPDRADVGDGAPASDRTGQRDDPEPE
jgi:hypothetical protein